MRKFSMLKKISSLVLAIVLTFSMAMPYLGTVFASNGTESATKIGWQELGVTEEREYETNASNQLIGVASMDTHLNMEFEGIVNFGSSSGAVRFLFSGMQKSLAFCVQANKDGSVYLSWRGSNLRFLNVDGTGNKICNQTLQDVDLILNLKMAFTEDATDATNSTGSIEVTLKNAFSEEILYNQTFNDLTAPTADLKPMAYAYTNGGKLTVKPHASAPENIGWKELGVTEETTFQTAGSNQSIGTATVGDSSNMEFEGIINFGASGGRVRFLFSGAQKSLAFCMQANADKSVYLSWRGTDIKYLNLEGESKLHQQLSQSLQDVDLLINIKLLFAETYNDATQSYGTLVVTLKDAETGTELYHEAFNGLTAPTAELKAMAYVNTLDNGKLTAKFPVTRVGWNELGVTENTTYTTVGENQKIGSATTNDFSNIEFEGIIHVASGGRVRLGFGGSDIEKAFQMQVRSDGWTYIRWNNHKAIAYINVSEETMISQSLQDTDLIINVQMSLASIDDTNSSGKMTVTLKDAETGTQLYSATFNTSEVKNSPDIATADLEASAWVYTDEAAALRVKLNTDPTTKIIVGGGETNTSAFPVLVENGGTLPTGYVEDGKYILGWSVGETEVTTYDNTQEVPVAEYVDTKMLTVLQQNDGEIPMDVRFIASLNTLEGYDMAGFVFANRPVDGELTIENGRSVDLNTAYATLNAGGTAVTATEIYDDYSQYFIAYALTDIPSGVTIYARAYVKVGDTVIYGQMSSFNIDNLNHKDAIVKDAVVLKVSDYGATGDGVTDDSVALANALNVAKTMGSDDTPVILEFEENKSYYFQDGNVVEGKDIQAIFPLNSYKNLTVRGDNTTLILDRTNRTLTHWFRIDQCENIKLEGFNLKWAQEDYAMATVDEVSITDEPYIDVTTDISLGITETVETIDSAFAMPYTQDVNRMHLYITAIEPLDLDANKYRVHINPKDNYDTKIDYVVENNISIILGVPGLAPYLDDTGSGSIVITSTENIELDSINVWDSSGMVFHMRYNTGLVHVHDSNVTSEPGANDKVSSWRDIFHVKDNRAQFIIEDCVFEKAYDDVFNFSVTSMEVTEVVSQNEAKMSCEQLGGYWSPLEVGDTITFVDEDSGYLVGRTKIKEVIKQGVTTHLVLEDEMPKLAVGVTVYVDSLGQTGSIIRNCTVNGTYRFRSELTVEDCELNTMYAWISNDKKKEGPIPINITFKRCDFNPVKGEDTSMSFMSPTYMMQIGASSSGIFTQFYADNIVFEDCDIDHTLINYMNNTANVSFVKNGEEYYCVEATFAP